MSSHACATTPLIGENRQMVVNGMDDEKYIRTMLKVTEKLHVVQVEYM